MTLQRDSGTAKRVALLTSGFLCAIVLMPCIAHACQTDLPRVIEPNDATGSSGAVIVGDWPLVHTAQLLPATDRGKIAAGGADSQVQVLFDRLGAALVESGSAFDRIIKLNVYVVRQEITADVQREMAKRFAGGQKPAVTFVVTRLPHADAMVAADAIATTSLDPGRGVRLISAPQSSGGTPTALAVVPRGTRLYIAGQAESGESLAEATRKTLEQLRATLQFLGRSLADVAQLKAFMTPMPDAGEVEREVATFFKDKVPPTAFVEWRSSAKNPIEIEMVAWGGMNNTGDVVEYATPPKMTASPVYSRVARINHSSSLFVSGLNTSIGTHTPDSIGAVDAEREVKEAFTSLERILQAAESDFKHLVKATYYVTSDAASQKLTELRPNYYDPNRPPSASKAMVSGLGIAGRELTMDMIAVPAWSDENPEYGPPEYGFGLSADDASAGWISLFDGRTTFGWTGAEVQNGALRGGKTTAAFGNCELRARFDRGGLLIIGGRERRVPSGEFRSNETEAQADVVEPIRLGEGVLVRELAVRPLGMKQLFNGHDMTGWKRIDHPGIAEGRRPSWQVEGGVLRARGGPGCVEFIGTNNDEKVGDGTLFGDMILQLDVRTRVRHSNGGVFFRAIPGDFMNGYEAQVFNRSEDGDPSRPAVWCTGGIDDRQNARRTVSRDGHFFKMTVIARGAHIATWVNGYQQTDWTDDRVRHTNPRQGLRAEPGVIQLQAHDPDTDVEFKNAAVSNW